MSSSGGRRNSLFHRASMFGSMLMGGVQRNQSEASFAESDEEGESTEPRTVHIGSLEKNEEFRYPPNFLKTSHYTLLNFLPLNLFHQFHQISNVYFFLVMVISLIPNVSPITPASAVAPLIFVLSTSAFKDGYEDWKRHRADRNDNSAIVRVLRKGAWKDVPSLDVMVGDIILMERGKGGEACPVKADVVILSSDDDDGVVYIETSQLDGETSVKPRKARPETQSLNSPAEITAAARGTLFMAVDQPNPKIYTWQGVLHLNDGSKAPLTTKNIIWRGSSMRKTAWAIACVIYTGKHTKQGKNLKKTKRKPSFLSKKVNSLVGGIFAFKHALLFPLCALSTWWRADNKQHWYLSTLMTENSDVANFFLNYMTYFVLLSFLIPISLFVTIEFCKVQQILLMTWDHEMFYTMPSVGWVGCRPKTSDLNEQLAVVKYVFTDKTGTLTENIMRYMEGSILTDGQWVPHSEVEEPGEIDRSACPSGAGGHFKTLSTEGNHADNVCRYLACMSMCHTVVPFAQDDGHVNFEGSSPDEVALVTCASKNRFVLTKRTSKSMTVRIGSGDHEFEILQELEFTPTRKMMSIILKDSEGRLYLFAKGADSSVLNSLRPNCLTQEARDDCQKRLVAYASQQFRTLCLAYRELSQEEYDEFYQQYLTVTTTAGRTDEMVDRVCMGVEKRLSLIGITAYEDKLQDGVPETIKFFTDAGVIIWMLTGDKLETGIEIGKTCGLADGAEVLPINVTREEAEEPHLLQEAHPEEPSSGSLPQEEAEAVGSAEEEAERRKRRKELVCIEHIHRAMERAKEMQSSKKDGQKNRVTIALDGPTLDIMQGEKEKTIEKEFINLSRLIHSAICCRLTPGQKGYIVNLFQRETGETAVAIGDGANDATMISAAMVGIGIIGLEGSQAELASDYAIPRFRFLKRLLAVHGRYSMYRNSRCVCFSFYKNIVLSLCQVYFAIFSAFSGTTLFDSWLLAIKNTLFSFFPPLLVGCFGKDISEEILMDNTLGPRLYAQMRTGEYFDSFSVWCWFIMALAHGSIAFWFGFPVMLLDDTDVHSGRTGGLIITGTYVMSMVVCCVLTKAAIMLHQITAIHASGIIFSYVLYVSSLYLYSEVRYIDGDAYFYKVAGPLFADPKHFLLCILIALGVVVTVDFSALYFQRKHRPTLRDICADVFDYKDPPWGKDRPLFGLFKRKPRAVHPVVPRLESEVELTDAVVHNSFQQPDPDARAEALAKPPPSFRKTSFDMINHPVRAHRAQPFPNALAIVSASPTSPPLYILPDVPPVRAVPPACKEQSTTSSESNTASSSKHAPTLPGLQSPITIPSSQALSNQSLAEASPPEVPVGG